MEISNGDIVLSVAGHDSGELFYVVATDGVYVSVANGKDRKIEHPKRKKIKHVCKVLRPDSMVAKKILSGNQILNSELRRDLAAISQEFNVSNQGG